MNETYLYALALSDGRIQGITSGPYVYVECDESVDDLTHYIDVESRVIKAKAAYEYTQEVEDLNVTLTGLPSGVAVTANGMQAQTDDDPMTISFDVPGTYIIELVGLVEYLDESLEVTVGEP